MNLKVNLSFSRGFEADLICSRLKLSKCGIAIPQAAHLLLNLFAFCHPAATKLYLTKILEIFLNIKLSKPKRKLKEKIIIFFTPDIGSHYSFPTVSAKRPSGSGFIGTR